MKKTINISKLVLFFAVVVCFCYFAITFPYELFFASCNNVVLTSDNFNELMKNSFLYQKGGVVFADDSQDEQLNEYIVNYKLFNLFDILSLKVKVNDNSVYLGGDCLGFSLKTKGLL